MDTLYKSRVWHHRPARTAHTRHELKGRSDARGRLTKGAPFVLLSPSSDRDKQPTLPLHVEPTKDEVKGAAAPLGNRGRVLRKG